jgi:glycerophosphoryl diester phosphodiesterase
VAFRNSADRMITLGELCDLVGGRVTVVIELKSRFDDERRLVPRTAEVMRGYAGPAALMSFDPAQIATLRALAPGLTRGMVADWRYADHEWDGLSAGSKRMLAYFRHAWQTRPQFVAYSVKDLPSPASLAARTLFGLPLLTWTVRTAEDRSRAARYADQMIFEGFRP